MVTLSLLAGRASAFAARSSFGRTQARAASSAAYGRTLNKLAQDGQAEVVLVGCGAPNRGMGWYHAIQMLDKE